MLIKEERIIGIKKKRQKQEPRKNKQKNSIQTTPKRSEINKNANKHTKKRQFA
ncbi:hypothetical protein NON27_29950 [Vibrio parahaemolyticus]|nr:hypothetical protein [Vibrio parahaemolyticus]